MTDQHHPLVFDYLARLQAEAGTRLPADRAGELVDDIRGHLADALAGRSDASEAEVRNVLERIGPPSELVEAAGGGIAPAATASSPRANRDGLALGLLVGAEMLVIPSLAFPPLLLLPLGMWIVGLLIGLQSPQWGGREKAALVAFLATGPFVAVALVLSLAVPYGEATSCSTITNADATITSTCPDGSGITPLGWGILTATVLYAAGQIATIVKLGRR